MSDAQLDVALNAGLPRHPEAERAVLGSILTNPHNYWGICTVLCAEDFFQDAHRHIWRAIVAICEEARSDLDTLTLKHDLLNNKMLDAAGGSSYISALVDGIPDVTNVDRYAKIVKEKSDLRRIIVTSSAAMRRALDDPQDTASVIASETAARLQGVAVSEDRQSRPMYDVVREVQLRAQSRKESDRSYPIPTGIYPILDYHWILRRKAVTIIGAPSGHGKSTLMNNLLVGAVRHDPSLIGALYSLEMSDEEVTYPLLSMIARVPLRSIQDRSLTAEAEERIRLALDWLRSARDRLLFADKIRDIDALYADCRRGKATRGLDVVSVDYFQLMRGLDARNPEQAVDRLGRELRMLAQDLDVSVIAGSQVNKERTKRASGRLSIADLKHGAVIAEHARAVCLFQRPRQDDPSLDGRDGRDHVPWSRTIFQFEKNTGRPTGDVPMHAHMPYQTFVEHKPSGGCDGECILAPRTDRGMLFDNR